MSEVLNPTKNVAIRLYCHGLGDCILLAFPREGKKPYYMMIDCGIVMGADKAVDRVKTVADSIATSIDAENGGNIDLLLVTHEHWDHVSGFSSSQARAAFEKIKFLQVRQAWTEDKKHPISKELLKRKKKAKDVATKALARMPKGRTATKRQAAFAMGVESVLSFFGDLGAAPGAKGTTEEAMKFSGTLGDLDLWSPGEQHDLIKDRVRVFTLGPPEDLKLLKKSDPSKKVPEVYTLAQHFGLASSLESAFKAQEDREKGVKERDIHDDGFPFDTCYRNTYCLNKVLPKGTNPDLKKFIDSTYAAKSEQWRTIEDDWLESAGQLALNLDSDTNNTSLAIAIELVETGEFLLFPGDAQVGNWLSWATLKFKQKGETITMDDIFANTVFYKVGHHGSHNATLRAEGLEKMIHQKLSAFIPVDKVMAKKKGWDEMPFNKLVSRLKAKTDGRLVIADEAGNGVKAPFKSSAQKPFGRPLYVDYHH